MFMGPHCREGMAEDISISELEDMFPCNKGKPPPQILLKKSQVDGTVLCLFDLFIELEIHFVVQA